MNEKFPPDGMVAVGDYAFTPPFVPTELQVQQAEEFVFTNPAFEELQEAQRRRNIVRLAIAAASCLTFGSEEGAMQIDFVPLIGGVAHLEIEQHEGTPVVRYQLLG